MDKLAIVVDSLMKATEALQDVITTKGNKVEKLERFEENFRLTEEKFKRFRSLVMIHENQKGAIHDLLHEKMLNDEKRAEQLRLEISDLKKNILWQECENEKLEQELKENIDRSNHNNRILNETDNSTYENAVHKSSPTSFITRLYNEKSELDSND